MRSYLFVAAVMAFAGCHRAVPPADRDQALVMDAVSERSEALSECAREHKKTQPEVGGKVVFNLTFAPDGTPASIQAGPESLRDTVFAKCAERVLRGITLAKNHNGYKPVNVPFKF